MAPLTLVTLALAAGLAGTPTFDEGLALFRDGEYEQAVFRFQNVSVQADLDDRDRAEALLWVGLSYASAGQDEPAQRAFEEALRLDPQVRPPPRASPKILALFDDVRSAAPAPPATNAPRADSTPAPMEGAATAPAPAPRDTEPASAASAASDGLPALVYVGGGVIALGVVSFGAALVTGWLAASSVARADDRTVPQPEAKRALDDANALLVGTTVFGVVGAVAVVSGGALVAYALGSE